jgi:phosphatidate cytidylyltransferase
MRAEPIARLIYAGVICTACALVELSSLPMDFTVLALSGAFWAFVVPFWLRFQWRLGGGVVGHVLGVVILVATSVALTTLFQRGAWFLLATMALVWVADIAAYFAGRRFGKHKLAPSISPGKTWEGVAGACLGVTVYGLAVLNSSLRPIESFSISGAVIALLALTGISVIGDLFESMLKRQAGLKDSSNLLPGHGGVLDRIDSLTSTLPVAALLIASL